MTAPAPSPVAEVQPASDVGELSCLVFVDEKNEMVCGQQAVDEILVRNEFGMYCVALCQEHNTKHREFYRALNEGRTRRRSRNRHRH